MGKCSICKQSGHNKKTCPNKHMEKTVDKKKAYNINLKVKDIPYSNTRNLDDINDERERIAARLKSLERVGKLWFEQQLEAGNEIMETLINYPSIYLILIRA